MVESEVFIQIERIIGENTVTSTYSQVSLSTRLQFKRIAFFLQFFYCYTWTFNTFFNKQLISFFHQYPLTSIKFSRAR